MNPLDLRDVLLGHTVLLNGQGVLLVHPSPEIEQLASLRTKRPKFVALIRCACSTHWALNLKHTIKEYLMRRILVKLLAIKELVEIRSSRCNYYRK